MTCFLKNIIIINSSGTKFPDFLKSKVRSQIQSSVEEHGPEKCKYTAFIKCFNF